PDWRRAQILLEQGRKMLPGLAASHPQERISVWMGHRPSLPDSLPVLGPSSATQDVIYAFSHGHAGITSAPMTGQIVAVLAAGRADGRVARADEAVWQAAQRSPRPRGALGRSVGIAAPVAPAPPAAVDANRGFDPRGGPGIVDEFLGHFGTAVRQDGEFASRL